MYASPPLAVVDPLSSCLETFIGVGGSSPSLRLRENISAVVVPNPARENSIRENQSPRLLLSPPGDGSKEVLLPH